MVLVNHAITSQPHPYFQGTILVSKLDASVFGSSNPVLKYFFREINAVCGILYGDIYK